MRPHGGGRIVEYLLEVYRQAGENARMYLTSRFSNLTGFLTYMGLLTAAVAFLYANQKDHALGAVPPEAPAGGQRSFVKGWRLFRLSATAATYGIYISSLLFFLAVGVISLVT